jgi:hypothetical protein
VKVGFFPSFFILQAILYHKTPNKTSGWLDLCEKVVFCRVFKVKLVCFLRILTP